MRSAPTTRPRQLSVGITGRWSSGSGRCRSADSQPQKSDPRNREVSGNGCGGCRTRADGSSHSHTGGLLTETADRLGPALCRLYNARGKRHVKNSCRLPLFHCKEAGICPKMGHYRSYLHEHHQIALVHLGHSYQSIRINIASQAGIFALLHLL